MKPFQFLKYLAFSVLIHRIAGFTLITFDVDGTLVKGSGNAMNASAHSRAYTHAVSTILNNGNPVQPVAEALPIHLYHGSTDGLILLRLARATLNLESKDSFPKLEEMFNCMYDFISDMEEGEVANHITTLPGVLEHLKTLATMKNNVMCGLVTGNVEGIARKKMKAVGVFETNALSPPCQTQKSWYGANDIGFLGGFGSDYCSGNIDDLDRNHLDRGEQIAIAVNRCRNILESNKEYAGKKLKKVVHVGDAPADVLAAKWLSQVQADLKEKGGEYICVGCVAVATGSYPADELRQLAGESIPGIWEPIILEDGMGDASFIEACAIIDS